MPELFTTYSPELMAVSLPTWIDLASVVVGSAGGVMVARSRHLDAVGFVGLALLCGLGGGLIRDVMMQVGSVYMLDSPFAIPRAWPRDSWPSSSRSRSTARATSWSGWTSRPWRSSRSWAPTRRSCTAFSPRPACSWGIMTGVGGGMLRDVFLGEVPRIFQKSNLYALCAFAGSAAYWCAVVLGSMNKFWGALLCIVVTMGLRRWSLRYNVQTPGRRRPGPARGRPHASRGPLRARDPLAHEQVREGPSRPQRHAAEEVVVASPPCQNPVPLRHQPRRSRKRQVIPLARPPGLSRAGQIGVD